MPKKEIRRRYFDNKAFQRMTLFWLVIKKRIPMSTTGPKANPIMCLPEERPSRDETIRKFVEWAKARPQYWNELPVETEFRFLTELWPWD
jgi:hypothetical protein